MSSKKRNTLGKGLEALLGGGGQEAAVVEPLTVTGLTEIELEQIHPGKYQPRKHIDPIELDALAASIRAQGIIQPIVVKRDGAGYAIIAGERRWRAAKLAGLTTIPVVVKDISEKKATAIALIENIQREDLNSLEEATALERLVNEFDLTHNQVAEAVGKSRATVSNLLRLLTLPKEIQQLLQEKSIDLGHAKVLMGVSGSRQLAMALQIAEQGLSVRESEKLVANQEGSSVINKPKASIPSKDPDVARLETSLSDKLGAAVEIIASGTGKGRIVVKYNSLDELEGILAHIQ